MSDLQKRWIKGERWNELEQVLALPIVQDALAIVEEEAKPNAPANAHSIRGLSAEDATFVLTGRLNIQSGMQAAVDRFRALGRPVIARPQAETPEPFGHITKDNYEDHLK